VFLYSFTPASDTTGLGVICMVNRSIRHPNVVQYIGAAELHGRWFLVTVCHTLQLTCTYTHLICISRVYVHLLEDHFEHVPTLNVYISSQAFVCVMNIHRSCVDINHYKSY
jgi:hypothetical protein